MVALAVVELLEEVGGKVGVFPDKGVDIIEVPRWGQEVPVESWGVEGVVAAGLVGWGSQNGRCLSS